MQSGHGKVAVCIVENSEVSATEGWADLQRSGMHSARILRQYYEGRVRDRAIALHLMDLKQAEHDGWHLMDLKQAEHDGYIHITSETPCRNVLKDIVLKLLKRTDVLNPSY